MISEDLHKLGRDMLFIPSSSSTRALYISRLQVSLFKSISLPAHNPIHHPHCNIRKMYVVIGPAIPSNIIMYPPDLSHSIMTRKELYALDCSLKLLIQF